MKLFLKNNIKSKGFLVWLVLDLIKLVKYENFILKVMSHFTLHLPNALMVSNINFLLILWPFSFEKLSL